MGSFTIVELLLLLLGIFGVAFIIYFAMDYMKHKDQLEPETNFLVSGAIGGVTNFFDTLGIGSFAPTTALLRGFKQINDRVLPGTLNVACTIPVVLEAFIFIKDVKVESVTLFSMLAAATIGAYIGAGIISKFSTRKIQLTMGFALLVTASIMILQHFGVFPGGGEAIGLSGPKLFIAVGINFILGMLMTAGIGLYAPCMALVYILGMSPIVAFPIMMGSCAFLMPACSFKFIKEGAYARKASLAILIFGAVGVFIAAYIVKSLPLDVLKWLVIAVVLYTSVTLFMSASKAKKEQDAKKATE